jgi:hypothetical protein
MPGRGAVIGADAGGGWYGIAPGTFCGPTPGGRTCGCSTGLSSSTGIGIGIGWKLGFGRLLNGGGGALATPTGPRLTGRIITLSNCDAAERFPARGAAI